MKRIVKSEEKLRKPASPVKFITETEFDTAYAKEVIDELTAVLTAKKDVVALAAPQIGIDARIFCIKFNDQIKAFVNPIITRKSNPKFICETCASFPTKQYLLLRPAELEVKYYNEDFKYEDNKLLDTAASLFDQQYQILDGVLPGDMSLVSDIEENGPITDEDLENPEEFYEVYKQLIKAKTATTVEEVASDEADKKLYNHLKFTENVINGRVQVVNPELDKELKNAKDKARKVLAMSHSKDKSALKQATKAELSKYLQRKGKRKK